MTKDMRRFIAAADWTASLRRLPLRYVDYYWSPTPGRWKGGSPEDEIGWDDNPDHGPEELAVYVTLGEFIDEHRGMFAQHTWRMTSRSASPSTPEAAAIWRAAAEMFDDPDEEREISNRLGPEDFVVLFGKALKQGHAEIIVPETVRASNRNRILHTDGSPVEDEDELAKRDYYMDYRGLLKLDPKVYLDLMPFEDWLRFLREALTP